MSGRKVCVKSVLQLLRKNKAAGLVVTNPADQFYLIGFSFYPGEAVLLVHPKGVVAFVRNLYVEALNRTVAGVEVIGCDEDRLGATLNYVKKHKLAHIGFDAAKEMYAAGKRMRRAGLTELPSLISSLRETKGADELKKMRAANRIAFLAYEYVRPRVKAGMMECEVASLLEQFMRGHGASALSFDTIVAFGDNAANPHHKTGTRRLKKNEAVLMDFGCIYEGYCSDITRSWWYGNNEPAEYTRVWKLVDQARRTGINAVRVGTATRQVDALARGVITQAGYGTYFTHRTGHGVGIEIHEEPCNSADSKVVLRMGNVVTVEPGIYLPGKFGVRLEDTVAVTQTKAHILTKK
ncbi:MAG: aminopeptidase P family protein [Elusimicrobiaceae bacterium]|nr:aminopeptidase P family protein [Elusimicrobiaceae bacterium]